MGYDSIANVHGHAEKSVAPLSRIGFQQRVGAWRHPDRQKIFFGDVIDRGLGQRDPRLLASRSHGRA